MDFNSKDEIQDFLDVLKKALKKVGEGFDVDIRVDRVSYDVFSQSFNVNLVGSGLTIDPAGNTCTTIARHLINTYNFKTSISANGSVLTGFKPNTRMPFLFEKNSVPYKCNITQAQNLWG